MVMNYRLQLVITAVSWLIWELAAVAQMKAISAQLPLLASAMAWILPFIGLISSIFLIEEKSWRGRIGITMAGATGSALGNLAVMVFWSVH